VEFLSNSETDLLEISKTDSFLPSILEISLLPSGVFTFVKEKEFFLEFISEIVWEFGCIFLSLFSLKNTFIFFDLDLDRSAIPNVNRLDTLF
jgi:hypothetical protein